MTLQVIVNGTLEDEKALWCVDTQEYILKGDYYHDKINERIEGFLAGLEFAEFDFEMAKEINAFPDDDVFELCDFYDETDE